MTSHEIPSEPEGLTRRGQIAQPMAELPSAPTVHSLMATTIQRASSLAEERTL
jgi:hypothetical protein